MQSGQRDLSDIGINPAITPGQCRAARAFVEMSRADLAKAAAVGERTIADFESRSRTPIRATLAAIQRALEARGVEFLAGNGLRLSAAEAVAPSGGEPGESDKPAGSVAPAPKKQAGSDRKAKPAALPRSKLEQIRALREQGTQ